MPENTYSSFDYFEALFKNTKENTVLLINSGGIILSISAAFTQCFGYAESDIIGKDFNILFTEEDQKKGRPENEIQTVLSKGQCADNNYLVTQAGHVIWVSGESILVKNDEGRVNILKVIQNIDKQKISEDALERSNDFNESILKSIEEAVVVLDQELIIRQSNEAFNKIFATDLNTTSLLNFEDIAMPYKINSLLIDNIRNVARSRRAFLNEQVTIDLVSGEKTIYDVSCFPLQGSNDDNVVLVMHDITVRKVVEREREDLIGFVAHELRNPLANVVLCNEVMSDAIKDNKLDVVKNMLERSKNNVMRLNKMIAELYDATRANSGNLKLETSTFNFEDMLKEATETVEVLQPAYKIIVKGNADLQITADRYKLIQVITNYLSNGIKYSNGKTDVTLGVEHNENTLTVSVRDEGLGISKDQLPYIFQKFFRAEKTRNFEGIGLGLYLCQQIIEAHSGKVWAESEEGKGSIFYFSIPI